MLKIIISKATDYLPIAGGGITGGLSFIILDTSVGERVLIILYSIILTIIGSIVGYCVRMLLDWIVKKIKNL